MWPKLLATQALAEVLPTQMSNASLEGTENHLRFGVDEAVRFSLPPLTRESEGPAPCCHYTNVFRAT